MEKFTDSQLFLLALNMELPRLLKFCRTSKKFNDNICKKDAIWNYKLGKEFPDYKKLKIKSSKRRIYELLYKLRQLKKDLKAEDLDVYELYNERKLNLQGKGLTSLPNL